MTFPLPDYQNKPGREVFGEHVEDAFDCMWNIVSAIGIDAQRGEKKAVELAGSAGLSNAEHNRQLVPVQDAG